MIKILCLGDSLTNGARNEFFRDYPIELSQIITEKKKIPNLCFNESVNGETSSEILKRATKIIYNNNYDIILFLAGTNDTKIPIPERIYQKNIIQLINLAKINNIKIFLGLLPPIFSGLPCYSQKEGNKLINTYNNILKDISKKHNIRYADFRNFKERLFSDGVHLNHRGYLEMAKKWYLIIKNDL